MMKYSIKTLLCLLLCSVSVFSQEKELLKADSLFKLNEYKETAAVYHQLLDSGFYSPELYYNLGNTYYRMGNIGYAILYYEKAHKLAPNDEDINHNLMFANSKKPNREEKLPDFFLGTLINEIIALFSLNMWLFITGIVYLCFIISTGIYFLSGKNSLQREAFFISAGILVLLMFVTFLTYSKYKFVNDKSESILVVQSAVLKNSPGYSSKNVLTIYEGIKLKIEEEKGDWTKVKLPDGRTGWMEKGQMEII